MNDIRSRRMVRTNIYRVLVVAIMVHLFIGAGIAQHMNILECMDLIGVDVRKCVAADISLEECDTIVDLESGYFEVFDKRIETVLCQIVKFNNADGSILIAVSGYFADMQCSNHPFSFYEISASGREFVAVEPEMVLPHLALTTFLKDSMPMQVLDQYLPEIRQVYLDSNSVMADLLDEIYDFHIIIPRKGTTMTVSLTVCDYIPRNEVSIAAEDWLVVEEQIGFVHYSYNSIQKKFEIVPSR